MKSVSAAVAALYAMLALSAHAAEIAAPGVLILYSNQRPTPAQVVIEDTLRSVVSDGLHRPVQMFSEYLDDEWASVEGHAAVEAEYLRTKYSGRNIRAIVAVALPALRFAATSRDAIASNTPVVHLSVARDRLGEVTLPVPVAGGSEDNDPTPTLLLALRLHPGTRHVLLIRGASALDRFWDQRLRAAAASLGDAVEVELLAGLPTTDVVRRVRALPPGTIVFTPGYFTDGAGEVTTPRQSIERIAASSSVPVYGAFPTQLGAGIVGGYMTRYEDEAKVAGAMVVRLLNGEALAAIESSTVPRTAMVDSRQLARWNIDENALPPHTLVAFREPT